MWTHSLRWNGFRLVLITLALAGAEGCKSSHHPAVTDAAADGGANPGGDASADGPGAGGDANRDGRADGSPTGTGGGAGGGGNGDGASGPDMTGGGGPDGASGDDAAPAADGGLPGDGGFGAGCNTLALGTAVPFVCSSDAVPTPEGGPIVAGTYQLTGATIYGPCVNGLSAAQTLIINTTRLQTVAQDSIIGLQHLNSNYTVSGTNMLQTNTCPNTDPRTVGFTATATTLTIFTTNEGSTTVGVLTRQ